MTKNPQDCGECEKFDSPTVHNRLATLERFGNGNAQPKGKYTKYEVDLNDWIGQTVRLVFVVESMAPNPTVFRIDDVSVSVDVPARPVVGPPDLVIVGFSGHNFGSDNGNYLLGAVRSVLVFDCTRSSPNR